MKLATLNIGGRLAPAIVTPNGQFIDINGADAATPASLLEIIQNWNHWAPKLAQIAAAPPEKALIKDATIAAPIPQPLRDIMCVGKNYVEHAHEFGGSGFDSSGGVSAVPSVPVIFTKATTSVVGPNEPLPLWRDPTSSVDYEGELALIIGKDAHRVPASRALEYVFGYVILNDVTSRELQKKHQQWFIGKGIDGFCPMGPWIVTADEVPDPRALHLRTYVNDELRQDAPVSDLIFDIPTLIETISASVSLKAGDIIATGTPAGVGIGFNPPRYLADGDVVRIEITGLGVLENTAEGTPPCELL